MSSRYRLPVGTEQQSDSQPLPPEALSSIGRCCRQTCDDPHVSGGASVSAVNVAREQTSSNLESPLTLFAWRKSGFGPNRRSLKPDDIRIRSSWTEASPLKMACRSRQQVPFASHAVRHPQAQVPIRAASSMLEDAVDSVSFRFPTRGTTPIVHAAALAASDFAC